MIPQDLHAGNQPRALPPVVKTGLPGWIGSAALHLLLVLLLAYTWSGPASVSTSTEDRPVAIVLATRNDNERTTYFDATKDAEVIDKDVMNDLNDVLPARDDSAFAALEPPVALASSVVPASLVGQESLGNLDLSGAGRRGRPWPDEPPNVVVDAVDGDSAAARGEPARPNIFGIQAEGRSFVFVIDRSHSMGAETGGLRAAERELIAVLDSLGPQHLFQIVAYNDKRVYFSREGLVSASDENKQRARDFLSHLIATGGTQHEMPLLVAIAWKPDVVFLLTDASDPPLGEPQLRRITSAAEQWMTIHCIQLGVGTIETQTFMQQLARLNRGSYVRVDVAADR